MQTTQYIVNLSIIYTMACHNNNCLALEIIWTPYCNQVTTRILRASSDVNCYVWMFDASYTYFIKNYNIVLW